MTCREKQKMEHPDEIIFDNAVQRYVKCPSDYDYLDCPEWCDGETRTCKRCWNREIPEDKGIISLPIKDAMTKFGEKCVEMSKELDEAYDSWSHELPEKFKPDVDEEKETETDETTPEIESDEDFIGNKIIFVNEPKKPDGYIDTDAIADKVIEKFNESGTGCAQSPEDIRKALERSEKAIKDSGNRTEFETGAVRDMREGKGRCDLMPLDVVASILRDPIIDEIARFQEGGKDVTYLYKALLNCPQSEVFPDVYTMFLEVAKHFEAGCKKYGEDNWRKGIPAKCYIDSAVRHYLKFLRGDKDEPHDRAFVWNILCCIWTIKHLGVDGNGAVTGFASKEEKK